MEPIVVTLISLLTDDVERVKDQFVPFGEPDEIFQKRIDSIHAYYEEDLAKIMKNIRLSLLDLFLKYQSEKNFDEFKKGAVWTETYGKFQSAILAKRQELIRLFASAKIYVRMPRYSLSTLYTTNVYQLVHRMVLEFTGQIGKYPHNHHNWFILLAYRRLIQVDKRLKILPLMSSKLQQFRIALDRYGSIIFGTIKLFFFDLGHVELAHNKPIAEDLYKLGYVTTKTTENGITAIQIYAEKFTYQTTDIFPDVNINDY